MLSLKKYINSSSGFTIIELLIVTTVSAIIGLSAFAMVNGQQARNEFSQSVRDMEIKLTDIANDASTGFFPNVASPMRCEAPKNSQLRFVAPDGTAQGRNSECIFAGKGIIINSGSKSITVETLAARKFVRGTDSSSVKGYDQLNNNDIKIYPGLSQSLNLLYGLQIQDVRYNGTTNPAGLLAFTTSFGGQNGEGQNSGAPVTYAKAVSNFSVSAGYLADFPTGITICVERGDGGRKASITFAQDGRDLTTTTEFDTSLCG